MACVEGRTFTWPPLLSAQGSRTVKTLDLFDALRLEDRGDLPLPHGVLESKKDVNSIFATLHPNVTRGSASRRVESAKAL